MKTTGNKTQSWLRRMFGALTGEAQGEARDWRCDPLGHPDLHAMTPDQLADLPPIHERRCG